ncbi:hypothetical protein KY284_035691 [Solanum tuberosum]|nr:hypothetical protein KY284_035691 [Solanum tuberosum]
MVFRDWSSLCLWLLGLFSWGLGGHLVAVLCLVLAGDGGSDGFGKLEARSLHGLCSGVEEEGERLGWRCLELGAAGCLRLKPAR